MIEQRVMVANILDDCARLLELAEGKIEHAYVIGYVGGRLAATAAALRSGDRSALEHIATALDGEVARTLTRKAEQESNAPRAGRQDEQDAVYDPAEWDE